MSSESLSYKEKKKYYFEVKLNSNKIRFYLNQKFGHRNRCQPQWNDKRKRSPLKSLSIEYCRGLNWSTLSCDKNQVSNTESGHTTAKRKKWNWWHPWNLRFRFETIYLYCEPFYEIIRTMQMTTQIWNPSNGAHSLHLIRWLRLLILLWFYLWSDNMQ